MQDRTATGVSNNDLMMLNGEGPDSSQDGKCFETAIVVECWPQTNFTVIVMGDRTSEADAGHGVLNKITTDSGMSNEEEGSSSQDGHGVSNKITGDSGISNKEGANSQNGTHF